MDIQGRGPSAVAAATIVLLSGAVLLFFVATRRLNNYLQPYFLPIVAITALVLLALGAWGLWAQRTRQPSRQDLGGHHGSLHQNHHGTGDLLPATSWLLLIPVLLAAVCAPNPLGSSLLNSAAVGGGQGTASASSTKAVRVRLPGAGSPVTSFPPLADGSATPLTLEELSLRMSLGNKADLAGKQVTVVGFAAPGNDGWVLGRFKIFCCAADALPFLATLRNLPQEVKADHWYEVTGTVDASGDIPALDVTSLNAIPQPVTPYL